MKNFILFKDFGPTIYHKMHKTLQKMSTTPPGARLNTENHLTTTYFQMFNSLNVAIYISGTYLLLTFFPSFPKLRLQLVSKHSA